jgi:MFS family permease
MHTGGAAILYNAVQPGTRSGAIILTVGQLMRLTWHFGLGRELGLAFWALTFFEASYGSYASVWPLWIERLGAPITTVGFVLGAAGVVRPFVVGGGSWLTDRIDTKKLLVGARSLAILGLVIAAFARSWELLLLTVVTNAVGELVFPVIHSHVAEHAGDNAARAFNMVITIGPASALIVTPFIAGAIIAIFGIPGAILFGALMSALGTLCVAIIGFHRQAPSTDASAPATYRAVLQHTGARNIVILHGCTVLALAMGSALIPNFLKDERGLSPEVISILSAGAAVGTVTFGFISMRHRKLRSAPVLAAAIATGLTATGYFLFAVLDVFPAIAIAYVLRGGLFSAWALFLAGMGEIAPRPLRTRAFALVEILGGSAISFGPVIASVLYRVEPPLFLIVSGIASYAMCAVLLWNHGALARARKAEQDAMLAETV